MIITHGLMLLALSAKPEPEGLLVELGIAGAEKPVEIALALEGGCASVKEQRQDAEYAITVCRRGAGTVLAFEVERALMRPQGVDRRKVSVEARIAVGRSAKIAAYKEGPGAAMELVAKVSRLVPAS